MSLPSDPTIAFVGLGNMGKFMALNLAKYLSEQKKQPLRVWNRTSSKARDLIKQSKEEHNVDLISVDTLKEVAKTCNVIITSLANDAVVKEVYQEFLNTLEKEGTGKRIIFIETSTVYPSVTTDLYKRAEAIKGVSFISSPPFGPPPMAKSAQLVFAVAGAQDARKEVEQYMVPSMGRKISDFGEDPSKASTFKLIGNSMIISTLEMLSETMTLADKTGVGSDRVLEWIKDFYPAPSAIGYGTKIVDNAFKADGGFTCVGGKKDATHIQRLGQSVGCPMHIVEKAIEHIDASIAANKSGEEKDWSSLVAGQRLESGMEPFGEASTK